MGLESNQAAVNTSIPLVGEVDSSIIPKAVRDMQSALKDGFITADEIAERVSQRAALKKILQQKQLQNQIAEQDAVGGLIQPRADLAAAQTKAALDIQPAQSAIAKKQSDLQMNTLNFTERLLPLAQMTEEYKQYQALQDAASGGDNTRLEAAASQVGIPVTRDAGGALTNGPEIQQKLGEHANFQKFQAMQKAFQASIESRPFKYPDPQGNIVEGTQTFWKNTQVVVDDSLQKVFSGVSPGSSTAAPTATHTTDLITPKAAIEPASVSIVPAGSTTSTAPAVGSQSPYGGIVTSVTPAKPTEAKEGRTQAQDLISSQGTLAAIKTARQQVATPGSIGPMAGSPPVQFANQIGAAFGIRSGEYTNQRQLEMLVNKKILEGAQAMKGNLSDRDVKFLQASVPKLSDTPETWTRFLNTWESMTTKNIDVLQGNAPAGSSVLGDWVDSATPAGKTVIPATLKDVPVVTSTQQVPAGANVVKLPDGRIFIR